MSTYLLAFIVSDFRSDGQIHPDVWFSVYSSQKTISSMRFALDTGVEALRAMEDYIGHNYTLNKLDLIAIDDFLMGAMVRLEKGKSEVLETCKLTGKIVFRKIGD